MITNTSFAEFSNVIKTTKSLNCIWMHAPHEIKCRTHLSRAVSKLSLYQRVLGQSVKASLRISSITKKKTWKKFNHNWTRFQFPSSLTIKLTFFISEIEPIQAPVFVEQPSTSSSIVVHGRTKFLQCKAKGNFPNSSKFRSHKVIKEGWKQLPSWIQNDLTLIVTSFLQPLLKRNTNG